MKVNFHSFHFGMQNSIKFHEYFNWFFFHSRNYYYHRVIINWSHSAIWIEFNWLNSQKAVHKWLFVSSLIYSAELTISFLLMVQMNHKRSQKNAFFLWHFFFCKCAFSIFFFFLYSRVTQTALNKWKFSMKYGLCKI